MLCKLTYLCYQGHRLYRHVRALMNRNEWITIPEAETLWNSLTWSRNIFPCVPVGTTPFAPHCRAKKRSTQSKEKLHSGNNSHYILPFREHQKIASAQQFEDNIDESNINMMDIRLLHEYISANTPFHSCLCWFGELYPQLWCLTRFITLVIMCIISLFVSKVRL